MQKGLDGSVVIEGRIPSDIRELKSKLKALLKDPKHHPEALKLLFQLAERLRNTRIADAWALARKALQIAKQLSDDKQQADAYLALADCSWKMAQYTLAIAHYEAALNIYLQKKDHAGVARSYNGIGIVCAETEELEQALEYFEHAMQYIKLSPESKLAAVITGNFGHAYLKFQKYENALLCFEHALNKHTVLLDNEGMANILGGIAGVHVHRREYREGLELLEKVKELRRADGSDRGMAVAMMNTGITLLRMEQFCRARQELQQARDLMLATRFTMYEPDILKHLMHASIGLGDTDAFNHYLNIYEDHRHDDIIQKARERQKQFREFQSAETRGLEQMLN